MSDLIWIILSMFLVLRFIQSSHFQAVSPEGTDLNLKLIAIYALISICVNVLLQWVQFNTQDSSYWYISRLGYAMMIGLGGSVYYISRLPFMDLFVLGLSWAPNQGIGTPGFVDPENKVDSAADTALEAARRNMPIALELREGELFDTVRLEDERRRDNPLTSPQDVQRSGYNAYDFLEEVLWWTEESSLQCHNSFATAPGSNGNLPAPGNESVLFTNCVSVERPGQVGPAINLIKQTLRNLPYYTTREPSRNQFKYAVGMNVEFLTFPTEFYRRNVVDMRGLGNESFRQPNGYDIGPDGNVILDGTARLENLNYFPLMEDQYLASCMSISVDKILVVNFHILHMIRNIETADQLQQLAAIFEQIIFDISIIKVWFNPQDDIIVLDATLDEIYRGTPRGNFNDDGEGTLPLTGRPELFSPTWKLRLRNDTQRAVFSTPRPAQFNFGEDAIWGMTCPYGFHNGAVDNYGHPCPCRTNNLDLAAMVELIMRDVGLVPNDDNGTQFAIRAWTEIRERCNYSDFEQCLLHGDRSSRLLRMLKSSIPAQLALPAPRYRGGDCAEECLQSGAPGPACSRACPNYQQWAEVSQETKARMLRTFASPSFQADPVLLGYVACHAVGISMILRFLMTTENPRL
ncbi:hypothetical protein DFP73DRAFT_248561 [Morchella snyderi]|nr:hypothetical protein DFP73DRAFT_248561 [Morchella snyderi]